MRRKLKRTIRRALISFILLWYLAPAAMPAAEAAADESSNGAPEVVFRAAAGASGQLEVTLTAVGAVDVYAFELAVRFDEKRLNLIEADALIPGFTVPPKAEDGRVFIAHTMIGPGSGLSGTVELAKLRFERVALGVAEVALTDAKLVDSEIASVSYAPNLAARFVEFADLAGHWAKSAIEEAARIGFVEGYPDDSFRPDRSVTRAEFAAMLVRALGLPASGGGGPDFSDSGEIPEWAAPYAAAAASAGIVRGYEDGSFRAGSNITRAEMAAMLARALGDAPAAGAAPEFADSGSIPAWAEGYVAKVYDAGIMTGRPNGRFDPHAQSTRAEAAAAILRLLGLK